MPYKDKDKQRASQRIRSQRYRERHPERIVAIGRASYQRHREARLAAQHNRYAGDLEFRERVKANARTRSVKSRRENRALVNALKIDTGCADCEYKDHAAALEFHHLDPATKSGPVSKFYGGTLQRLQAEIDKCIVLCGNCHAIREYEIRAA